MYLRYMAMPIGMHNVKTLGFKRGIIILAVLTV